MVALERKRRKTMTGNTWIAKVKHRGKRVVLVAGFLLAVTGCGMVRKTDTEVGFGQECETGTEGSGEQECAAGAEGSSKQECEVGTEGSVEQECEVGAEGGSEQSIGRTVAVYLGVEHYGAAETRKENRDTFRYRFEVDGEEVIWGIENGTKDGRGNFEYPIQNILKEGYSYEIRVENGIVTEAVQLPSQDTPSYEPPVAGTPGKHTLGNFLATALEPVGIALYIYGGGWDWQDEGSSIQAETIGISPDWIRFFYQQNEDFTYRDEDAAKSFYPYGGFNEYYYAGLDCSGYLGWVVYNTLHDISGEEGYVVSSTGFAKGLADRGFGDWTKEVTLPDGSRETAMKPGDIMSIKGHVWISLGTCPDGSVVIVHSTPSQSRTGHPGGGVQIGAVGNSENCEAFVLADYYMSQYYPEWYRRYGVSLKTPETYFESKNATTGRFTWFVTGENSVLTDPEGFGELTPAEVLSRLFG